MANKVVYYFHNLLSASGGFVHRPPPWFHPWTPLGDFGTQTLNLPTPGKNTAGAHVVCTSPEKVMSTPRLRVC